MKKLIIHIGYPKTATSTMQLNLFSRLKEDGKIEYLNHLDANRDGLGNISVKKILDSITGLNDSDYSHELQALSEIKNPLTVLSCESISHVSEKSTDASIKIGAFDNAKKIKQIFSSCFDAIEIIMTIRAQKTIIPSYYTQEYFNIINKNPSLKDIGAWLHKNFGQETYEDDLIFNYNKMYSTYSEVFGKENVNVLVYEDLSHNKTDFYRKIADIFNIDEELIRNCFENRIRNKTIKTEHGNILTDKASLKSILVFFAKKTLGNEQNTKSYRALKTLFNKLIPAAIFNLRIGASVSIRSLKKEELELISDRFSGSNNKLFLSLGIDPQKMTHYGYF